MRELTKIEIYDLAALARSFDAVATFEVTKTQLRKSIIDATESVRAAMRDATFHDYSRQGQGQDYKVARPILVLGPSATTPSRISMYRPETKAGDPRMWLGTSFRDAASPGEVWALALQSDGQACAVPLGRGAAHGTQPADSGPTPAVRRALTGVAAAARGSSSAERLLRALLDVAAKGPVSTHVRGDTAVGVAIESALGIAANASRGPDWEGLVEIKGRRAGRSNRQTMFSRVPRWELTPFGSREEVLLEFGHPNPKYDNRLRLYNTVSAVAPNSHGLQLSVDHEADVLRAVHVPTSRTAMTWPMGDLRSALERKHVETFWVSADAVKTAGNETFALRDVLHTARPRGWVVGPLLDEGVITLDTTIGMKANGKVRDHGWLFKMSLDDIPDLFPIVARYELA